jgi:HAMP domain-containing protein
MAVVDTIRESLGLKITLKLAVLMVGLTAAAAIGITFMQTESMEALTLEKARVAATIGARQYGDFFDNAIDSGLLTVGDVFDRNYQEIKGYDFAGKPKFHTRYDAFTDRGVLVFQDKFLDHKDFLFAVGVDENGYLPTHNTRFQKPVTGDAAQDLAGNRTKRKFDDPVGIKAAKNTEPSLVQEYQRDTGETMWDVSAPIYVKGKHWGGFRVAVSMQRIADRMLKLLWTLIAAFGLFGVVTLGAMYTVVKAAMKPVKALTDAGNRISLGEDLDTPIKTDEVDEIGKLTKTIDRLRQSMKAAMARLGQ